MILLLLFFIVVIPILVFFSSIIPKHKGFGNSLSHLWKWRTMFSWINSYIIPYLKWTLIQFGYAIPDILRVHYLLRTSWNVHNLQEKEKLIKTGSFQKLWSVDHSNPSSNEIPQKAMKIILLNFNITFQFNRTSIQLTYCVFMPWDQRWLKMRSHKVQNFVEKQTYKQSVTIQYRKYRLLQQEE